MRKIMYIITDGSMEHVGLQNKILAQAKAFRDAGLQCELYELPSKASTLRKVLNRIPLALKNDLVPEISDVEDVDGVYIRKPWPINAYEKVFWRKIRKINPKLKYVLEVYTYPYDDDNNVKDSLKQYSLLVADRINRKHLVDYVDRIATLTDDKEIFGVPTLRFHNGIDMSKFRICDLSKRPNTEIHVIAVALFREWHGYERMIEGINNFYQQGGERKIVFHLVGYGPESTKYQALVDKYNLHEHVILHGKKVGTELDAIYDKCSLGISSLTMFRINLGNAASLKTREYMAKGLPFITDANINDVADEEKNGIYLRVPSDESPIDVNKVLEFYDRIYQAESAEDVAKRIRQYAAKHFSMDVAMKEVIDYFLSDER